MGMTSPIRYSQDPVQLPLDQWLVEGHPVPGCKKCAVSDERRSEAVSRKDWRAACAAARDIRSHNESH
ncbi:hypothetical protein SSP35_01_04400 [Streptomyces sp. NBRC 110611]|nr:hypothetical protein SSP35_01_04400 [Streptomyces sp. NBRC 110611]